ncbi:hypothetical protein IH982_01210 [Patescibacteria group bacterium]|nr:hypothetical protein [Patescibacteria group bacterium]
MYLDIVLGFYNRADGGYAPWFMIFERDGGNTREIPFDCKETAQSEKEAIRIAKAHALKILEERYSSSVQVRFREK